MDEGQTDEDNLLHFLLLKKKMQEIVPSSKGQISC